MNARIRERWPKSINKEFFISKPLHFTTGGQESRSGRREKKPDAQLGGGSNHLEENLYGTAVGLTRAINPQHDGAMVTRPSRRWVDNISKTKRRTFACDANAAADLPQYNPNSKLTLARR
jgi:hypothetical protein